MLDNDFINIANKSIKLKLKELNNKLDNDIGSLNVRLAEINATSNVSPELKLYANAIKESAEIVWEVINSLSYKLKYSEELATDLKKLATGHISDYKKSILKKPQECKMLYISKSLLQKNIKPAHDSALETIENYIDKFIDNFQYQEFKAESTAKSVNKHHNSSNQNIEFVAAENLDELKKIDDSKFDLSKLIKFCEELNDNFARENYLSCSLIFKAVINHIPPIFGHTTFPQVVSHYPNQSVKKILSKLEDHARKVGDLHTHNPIRKKEVLPTKNQIEPFKAGFEVLLHEIIVKLT